MDWERPFTIFGISLIIIGFVLIILPNMLKYIARVDLEKIPWFLLYVYKKDNFVFATSPILIIIGITSLLWAFLHR
jgi:hypothetical protein